MRRKMKKIVLSKVEQLNEFIKCKNSFDYFCRNYAYIEIAGGDELIHPYKKQSELINYIEKEKYVCVLKSRQIGISTIIQAYCAYLVTFFDNVVVGIISKDGAEATTFSRTIRGIVEKLPVWLKPKKGASGIGFDKYTEQSFILTNGSKVFASTVNPMAPEKTLRGKAITFLVIDEAAFIKNIDIAWTSIVPALSTSHRQARVSGVPYGCLVLSTPNRTTGAGAFFYGKYTRAVSRVTEDIFGAFKPFVIHWKMVEELSNDPNWYKVQCEMFDHDIRKIDQELELKFLPAGGSFFDEKTCVALQNGSMEPIEIMKLFNGEIWVFEKAVEGKFYIIGVDTAAEYGSDNSAITIWDYETLNQVWEYQGKLPVKDFEKVVRFACSQYPGTCVIESTGGYGNQVVEGLDGSPHASMLYREKHGEKQTRPGLTTSAKTRPLMIDALYDYITKFPEIVKSKRIALELIGLVTKASGKVEADSECRDDLALTFAMIGYVRKYDPPLMLDVSRYHESMFEDIVQMNDYKYNPKDSTVNQEIMRKVKETVWDPTKALVNTLDFYKE
jgi:hypothetical protein